MISDPSLWVDIDIESWNYIEGSGVEPVGGGYALNGSSISTSIELTGNQQTTRYGLIFTVANLVQGTNYAEATFYNEGGSLLNAGMCYLPISENGRVWVEIPTQKTFKVEVSFHGDYTVTGMQIYAVATSVGDATYTEKGVVVVDNTAGLVVADGKIGANIGDGLQVDAEGKITTTSDLSGSHWQNLFRFTNGFVVNGALKEDGTVDQSTGYFFERQANGDLLYKNANRTIKIASYNSSMPTYTPPAPPTPTEEESGTNAV